MNGVELGCESPRYTYDALRWLSRDPIADLSPRLAWDGLVMPQDVEDKRMQPTGVSVKMLQGPNLYEYVQNDPTDKLDPSGLISVPVPGGYHPAPPTPDSVTRFGGEMADIGTMGAGIGGAIALVCPAVGVPLAVGSGLYGALGGALHYGGTVAGGK
jgi:hypothetical protein